MRNNDILSFTCPLESASRQKLLVWNGSNTIEVVLSIAVLAVGCPVRPEGAISAHDWRKTQLPDVRRASILARHRTRTRSWPSQGGVKNPNIVPLRKRWKCDSWGYESELSFPGGADFFGGEVFLGKPRNEQE